MSKNFILPRRKKGQELCDELLKIERTLYPAMLDSREKKKNLFVHIVEIDDRQMKELKKIYRKDFTK